MYKKIKKEKQTVYNNIGLQESPDKIKRNEELDNTEYELKKINNKDGKNEMKNLSPETNKKKKRE